MGVGTGADAGTESAAGADGWLESVLFVPQTAIPVIKAVTAAGALGIRTGAGAGGGAEGAESTRTDAMQASAVAPVLPRLFESIT